MGAVIEQFVPSRSIWREGLPSIYIDIILLQVALSCVFELLTLSTKTPLTSFQLGKKSCLGRRWSSTRITCPIQRNWFLVIKALMLVILASSQMLVCMSSQLILRVFQIQHWWYLSNILWCPLHVVQVSLAYNLGKTTATMWVYCQVRPDQICDTTATM